MAKLLARSKLEFNRDGRVIVKALWEHAVEPGGGAAKLQARLSDTSPIWYTPPK